MTEEMITINTENNIIPKKLTPFPVYGKDNPLLKQIMPEYTGDICNKSFTEFVTRLKMTRKAFGGVGLAANQCGIEVRVFVVGTDDYDMVCINPKLIAYSDLNETEKEGCLSFPMLRIKVSRPINIKVEYYDVHGELIQRELGGLTARCFMHELDHLNGISITDKVGKMGLYLAKQKQLKNIKKISRRKKY